MSYMKKIITMLSMFFVWSLVPSGRDTMTCSNVVAGTNQNVQGQNTNCTGGADEGGSLSDLVGLNAFKDRVSWTIKRSTPKQDLGKITANKDVSLKYPAVGKMKIVSFIPTDSKSHMANKKVEILFVSFSIYDTKKNAVLPDSSTDAKGNLDKQLAALKEAKSPFENLIKVYRKMGNEKQWSERAELYTKTNPDANIMDTSWTVMPDGMVQAADKLYQTDVDGKTTAYEGNTFDLTMLD